jgi:hypothetical protein
MIRNPETSTYPLPDGWRTEAMSKWRPDPKVVPLLNALRKAEQRHATMNRNERLGRDRDTGQAVMFESLLPNSRGSVSPLGGQAKPKEEAK